MTNNNLATKDDLKLLEDRIVHKIEQKFDQKIDQKIEEFAGQIMSATVKGFGEVNGRLDKVENRLDKVENRLDKVENRLDGVEEGLDEVKTKITDLKYDVNNLKTDSPSKAEFQNHERRISHLEKATFPHQSA